MTWQAINLALVVGVVVVLIFRLVVVSGYGRGTSLLLTFYLPTAAMLLVMIRIMLTRYADLLTPNDAVTAVGWALLLVTQLAAAIHAWWPKPPRR